MDILVVDPEAEIRLLFFVATDQLGCEVYFAESGGEALHALASHDSIGMVLISVDLPDVDACTLAETIRVGQTGHHFPIVFLSSTEDSQTLVELLDHGDDVVIKPFSQPVLLAKLLALRRTQKLYEQIERHNVELEHYRAQVEAEHQIATDVFSRLVTQHMSGIAGISTFVSPFSSFNGDLLLIAPRPGEGLNILIADITGHGLPAALGTMPIAETFFAKTEQGFGVGDIAREMNRVFRWRMPDYLLCAAVLIAILDNGRRLQIWSGGMPALVIFDSEGLVESLLPSRHMALGALSEDEFEDDIFTLNLKRGQRILSYTDGVTEASNAQGEMFGEDRLIKALAGETGQAAIDQLRAALYQHADGVPLSDDLTIFCLDTEQYTGYTAETASCALDERDHWEGFSWQTEVQFSAEQIKTEQPLDLMFSSFPAHPIIRAARSDLSVIINELFVNALDHGLLGLDSSLKEQGEGLLEYFILREECLQALDAGTITFKLSCRMHSGIGEFEIYCKDSGAGFDHRTVLAAQQDDSRHSGRGLRMITAMCEKVVLNDTGNAIALQYRWPPQLPL